jgi:predicted ATP-grasp superfamily ATP-dependent carboligase
MTEAPPIEVIVLDGHTKSALAVVRALGRAHYAVRVGSQWRYAMAGRSYYAAGRFRYPDPQSNPVGFLDALQAQLAKTPEARPLIISCSDATTLLLSRHRGELEDSATLLLPSAEAVETAYSKHTTHELARTLAIPVIAELSLDTITTWPVVVKPRHTTTWYGSGYTGTAQFVFSGEELSRIYEQLTLATGEAPIIMEYIEGDEYGFECVCKDGEILQSFAHHRVRSLSPRGGAATVKEVSTNDAVNAALRWTGPMMVEGKIDNRTGEMKLMELNGRIWGSIPLPQAAGVNFATGLVAIATGGSFPADPHRYQVTRTQHWLGDVQWLWRVLFSRDRLRSQLYPSRLRAILTFTHDQFFTKGDVWSFDDMRPVWYEIVTQFEKVLWK